MKGWLIFIIIFLSVAAVAGIITGILLSKKGDTINYSCNSATGKCEKNKNGNYKSLKDCEKSCKIIPPDKLYECVNGNCVKNTSGKSSLSDCTQTCSPGSAPAPAPAPPAPAPAPPAPAPSPGDCLKFPSSTIPTSKGNQNIFDWKTNDDKTLVTGSWTNAANGGYVSINNISAQNNLIMLASYCPDPWSKSYCNSVAFTMNILNWCSIYTGVQHAKKITEDNVKVLISVGGSSFGDPEWCGLIYGNENGVCGSSSSSEDCDCPSKNASWLRCSEKSDFMTNYEKIYGQTFVFDPTVESETCCTSTTEPYKYNHHQCMCQSGYVYDGTSKTCIKLKPQCVPNSGSSAQIITACYDQQTDETVCKTTQGCYWSSGGSSIPTCSPGTTCKAPSSTNPKWHPPPISCTIDDENATSKCVNKKCGCPFTTGIYRYGGMGYNNTDGTFFPIKETDQDSGKPIGTKISGGISAGAAPMLVHILKQTTADGFDLDFEGGIKKAYGPGLVLLCYLVKKYATWSKSQSEPNDNLGNQGINGVPIFTYTPLSGPGSGSQGTIKESNEGDLYNDFSTLIQSLLKIKEQWASMDYTKGTYPADPGYSRPGGSGPGGWLMQSFLYSDCPFDYVVPMLYNGGQYGYCPKDCQSSHWPIMSNNQAFNWNGLLNYWIGQSGTLPGVVNPPKMKHTKLLPAFIAYDTKGTFCKYDLERFIEEYLQPSQDDATWKFNKIHGAVFFYYNGSGYSNNLMNNLVEGVRYSMSANEAQTHTVFNGVWTYGGDKYGNGYCGTYYNGKDCTGKSGGGGDSYDLCSKKSHDKWAATCKQTDCLSSMGNCGAAKDFCSGWDPSCCTNQYKKQECAKDHACASSEYCVPRSSQPSGWCSICNGDKSACNITAQCECVNEKEAHARCPSTQ